MKKVDLHIHTVSTKSDSSFEFDINTLKDYVQQRELDVIAIVNHNLFDIEQYNMISKELPDTVVFPGIEVNIGQNKGHLIVISDIEHVVDFAGKCEEVEKQICTPADSLNINQFKSIFGDLKQYLLIPHYDKTPSVDKTILKELEDNIFCGEVNSPKKFIYCMKDDTSLCPVYFSDFRAKKDETTFPVRQTYIDVDEISVASMKKAFIDKKKVCLTRSEGNDMFEAFPDFTISTGLNVIMGGRSSGKTYTLDKIEKSNANVKYIRQFDLLEKDSESVEEKKFTGAIANKRSYAETIYFAPFKQVVEEIKDISLEEDDLNLNQYLESLIKHAKEYERADSFAKCKLYSESKYQYNDLQNLDKIIQSAQNLLECTQYQDIITAIIDRDKLIELLKALINRYIAEDETNKKRQWVDSVVADIKRKLQAKSSSIQIPEVDFYKIQMNRKKVELFDAVVKKISEPIIINEQELEGFKIRVSTELYTNARDMQTYSKSKMKFSDAFNNYGKPYKFLKELIGITELPESEYYKYFVKVKYEVLNKYGYKVSGGERAEFNLLQQIQDARQYDILMIDEPESSFDNLFLKDKVNHMIKDISQDMPVIIVTHNSTIGASIKPDYLIYTVRNVIDANNVEYEIYTGHPSNKILKSRDGKDIPNIQVTMDCLEAGEEAYKERQRDYEILRN